ncbi:MAG: DUF1292 domain-containing protein [Acidaminococcus sp.]|jgi:uncharacterized protein YrzB (UPF0473 family)|nr:DUF1292 domain-containing protein [Acidaminococcus sp.]MCI2099490.1 DUF1292 domain-containing protein [Acidaminococcus sp.]MCI2113850.1 DUF1292 domain-containing protein [Acidaminococcus sp.]MCI2115576.1 DUF1292 domain-containing protein [Acidaminococcus sp.]
MTKEKDMMDTQDQEELVIITDEAGNETYYTEEMVIPVDNKNFALLVKAQADDEAAEDDDDTVIIARMEFDENGEPLYLDPTDEEFEVVKKAYDAIMDEMEKQDEE